MSQFKAATSVDGGDKSQPLCRSRQSMLHEPQLPGSREFEGTRSSVLVELRIGWSALLDPGSLLQVRNPKVGKDLRATALGMNGAQNHGRQARNPGPGQAWTAVKPCLWGLAPGDFSVNDSLYVITLSRNSRCECHWLLSFDGLRQHLEAWNRSSSRSPTSKVEECGLSLSPSDDIFCIKLGALKYGQSTQREKWWEDSVGECYW